MVKHLHIALSDEEYAKAKKRKGNKTWSEYVIGQ